ncbi:hypothetical protein NA57DRAFT_58115 [Rhizodiscina lignyota]|uniref:ThrRS/AlaRS common domain-containing protein n=1 Tax=Rhizodiscina lignyota TaxID=1504668 RepID=A0A9P4IDA1_9PEZI|nr:hypothetical protein NA57DRAFT_58115 [Rhizodiscina lignyota]
MSSNKLCHLIYQHDDKLYTTSTTLTACTPFPYALDPDRAIFKSQDVCPSSYVVETKSTIFHAQGGGQPSDVGAMSAPGVEFDVLSVRHAPNHRVLHLGNFKDGQNFKTEVEITQRVDEATRLLHSRIHTAGHLLSLAIRSLSASASAPPASTIVLFPTPDDGKALLPEIEELKASHYPGAAFVEFKGLIPGDAKAAIQSRCDEIVAADLPVQCHWWEEGELRTRCANVTESIDGLLEEIEDGKKQARAMEVVGLGAYPCGGTHVGTTLDVGRVVVRNIKRAKGPYADQSRKLTRSSVKRSVS